MKSIEEKAKRYDEALKVLHKYDGANIMFSQSLKEEMFPELKESEDEDERIRKDCIKYLDWEYQHCYLSDKDKIEIKKCIAWLEKQTEQKPAWSEEDEWCSRQIDYHLYNNDEISDDKAGRLRNWLKSLKDRYTWKPSDEQMGVIAQALGVLKVSGYDELGDRLGDISEQLNKLRGE